jgi:hypothetical protein
MRTMPLACLLLAGLAHAATPASADEHRQLGAHVHGHGRLNIAIEGNKLSMELEAPGADVAGFEHEAGTPEEKAAIPEAKAKLANALALFGPAPAAGCALDEAKVSLAEEHEHEDEHKPGASDASAHEDEAGHHHSEFRAAYSLTCSAPAALTSLTFGYFTAFAGAQELDVAVIGPKGQSSFEVTRGKPTLDLTGAM